MLEPASRSGADFFARAKVNDQHRRAGYVADRLQENLPEKSSANSDKRITGVNHHIRVFPARR